MDPGCLGTQTRGPGIEYLGHHWAYRREVGEPQLVFNYVRALSDYITNFTFAKGVSFRSPPSTEAIVPSLLKRVWEQDNPKERVLWEMGQIGGVTGDVFIKIAYEDPWIDPLGRIHPGRVRIIPLNPAFCFPEFHPHDRTRLLRFKLKYRFWGTGPDGTRQVWTYTELITDSTIEEYINDELIEGGSRPNPLGKIPIVHIPNLPVSGSPWGMSDIGDIIPLNREFNEKATEVSDVINYHSSPVTVIIGAKASNLEKGPRKVWGIPNAQAKIENLQLHPDILQGPLEYLKLLKLSMHEMTGVPEAALGQMQPISNTSGVALAIMYQPLMNRYAQKKVQYTLGLQQINELVMLTLVVKEPNSLLYNPGESGAPKAGQVIQLDPYDPVTYENAVHWPPPLPIDILVKLNEIMAKMQLGLESKRGALAELGEEFPDEKMDEIFAELVQDKKEQGALDMLAGQIQAAIFIATGGIPAMLAGGPSPAGGGGDVTSAGDPASPLPGISVTPIVEQTAEELTTLAYGTKLAQQRNPSNSSS